MINIAGKFTITNYTKKIKIYFFFREREREHGFNLLFDKLKL